MSEKAVQPARQTWNEARMSGRGFEDGAFYMDGGARLHRDLEAWTKEVMQAIAANNHVEVRDCPSYFAFGPIYDALACAFSASHQPSPSAINQAVDDQMTALGDQVKDFAHTLEKDG